MRWTAPTTGIAMSGIVKGFSDACRCGMWPRAQAVGVGEASGEETAGRLGSTVWPVQSDLWGFEGGGRVSPGRRSDGSERGERLERRHGSVFSVLARPWGADWRGVRGFGGGFGTAAAWPVESRRQRETASGRRPRTMVMGRRPGLRAGRAGGSRVRRSR